MARRRRATQARSRRAFFWSSRPRRPGVPYALSSPPASHGLPPYRRLKTPAEFQRVQQEGRRVGLGPLTCRLRARKDAAGAALPARLGLAVSRRAGGSVQRNRIKRLVRDAFRRRAASLDGYDLVVSAYPEAAGASQPEVDRLFDRLLAQLASGDLAGGRQ